MTAQDGTFTPISWDEKLPEEPGGSPRISHAHTTNKFDGVIEGTTTADHVMYYSGQGEGWGSGTYHGYEQITGEVGGRSGSFVLEHTGDFGDSTVRATWSVVEGSGTAELTGLRGKGGFVSKHGEASTAYTFEYEFVTN
ncbi:DUF3224 domain-containing protein [Actinopolymorpha alba]|uniref:DUF3224 domain-containing protein n=1 Tax=Actinopolymorpha alba TaxID=533267 RepID=UPI0003645F77|nr:DUF3224 domain-containing protein [Actinopolymorpha alba]